MAATTALGGCGDGEPGLAEAEATDVAMATLRAYERGDAPELCARFSARERAATAKGTGSSCESTYEQLFAAAARARRGNPFEQAGEALRVSFLPGEVADVERRADDRVVVRVRQPPPPKLTAEQRRAAVDFFGEKTFERMLKRRRELVVPVSIVLEQGRPRVELSFRQ